MNKILYILLSLFLFQGCSNMELANVSYENVNFDSSKIKNKMSVNVEKNIYCVFFVCNRYNYGRFSVPLNVGNLAYDIINENRDKGNAITDMNINEEIQDFIFYYHKKITLTGNMFYDTSSQP